jgi:hypothetical protein
MQRRCEHSLFEKDGFPCSGPITDRVGHASAHSIKHLLGL